MAQNSGLSEIELIWLIAWNIADGQFDRIGLEETEAKELLLDFFGKLEGDPLDAAKWSRGRLSHSLMALRQGSFEEIQQEAPFSRYARTNMERLLRAWVKDGEAAFAQAWGQIFRPGWEAARESQDPIQIVGGPGDSEKRALEVKGAPDQETRIAAEWWYLYYTYGRGWAPEMHATANGTQEDVRFSIHHIRIDPDARRHVYFRLPW